MLLAANVKYERRLAGGVFAKVRQRAAGHYDRLSADRAEEEFNIEAKAKVVGKSRGFAKRPKARILHHLISRVTKNKRMGDRGKQIADSAFARFIVRGSLVASEEEIELGCPPIRRDIVK